MASLQRLQKAWFSRLDVAPQPVVLVNRISERPRNENAYFFDGDDLRAQMLGAIRRP